MKNFPAELMIEEDLVRTLTPEEVQGVAGGGAPATGGVICYTITITTNICTLVTQGCGATGNCATTGCGSGGGTTTCGGETGACGGGGGGGGGLNPIDPFDPFVVESVTRK